MSRAVIRSLLRRLTDTEVKHLQAWMWKGAPFPCARPLAARKKARCWWLDRVYEVMRRHYDARLACVLTGNAWPPDMDLALELHGATLANRFLNAYLRQVKKPVYSKTILQVLERMPLPANATDTCPQWSPGHQMTVKTAVQLTHRLPYRVLDSDGYTILDGDGPEQVDQYVRYILDRAHDEQAWTLCTLQDHPKLAELRKEVKLTSSSK